MNYKKILRSLVLGLGAVLVVAGVAYAATTVSGTLTLSGTRKIDFDKGGSSIYDNYNLHIATDDKLYFDATRVFIGDHRAEGVTKSIEFGAAGGSKIYENYNLHVATNDKLYLDTGASGMVYVENDATVAGDLAVTGDGTIAGDLDVTGTITGTSVASGTTATTFTFGSGSDADDTNMTLNLGGTDPAVLAWASGTHTLSFSDNLKVSGTTTMTGLLTANANIGIDITSPITGITAGASSVINWTGTSEWLRIFLQNLDTTPGSSAAVISLTNAASMTSGDQIALELKNDLKANTAFAGSYFTTLRARVEFKDSSTYTSGHVQPIYASLGAHADATLTGSDLRVAYLYTNLPTDPGHAEIMRLENNCLDQAYLDTHITFIGPDSGSAMTFGPNNGTSWNSGGAGVTGTKAGFIKVVVGGADRYIRLYDAAD